MTTPRNPDLVSEFIISNQDAARSASYMSEYSYESFLESKIAELRASLALTDATVTRAESANAVLRSQVVTLEALANDSERVALRRRVAALEAALVTLIDASENLTRNLPTFLINDAREAWGNTNANIVEDMLRKLVVARSDAQIVVNSPPAFPAPDCSATQDEATGADEFFAHRNAAEVAWQRDRAETDAAIASGMTANEWHTLKARVKNVQVLAARKLRTA